MSKNVNVDVKYLTRVEGHGNILVNVENGNIEKCEWQVIEAPRFFESMVVGRNWKELHHITSRICGICSIGHTTASVKATEDALGIEISEQDKLLRKIALHGENTQSHILHVGYLALPDLFGAPSVIPLTSSHPKEVKTVIRIHRLANEMSTLLTGRTTHPQRIIPGGFSKIPTEEELKQLRERLENSKEDLEAIADLLKKLAPNFPDFSRETEFISLKSNKAYPLYEGELFSSDTGIADLDDYENTVNEYIVEQSTAKYAKNNRESYMVGALARLNNNFDQLTPEAKELANEFNLVPICHNPYMNNIAQFVEIVHSFEDSIQIIDKLLDAGLQEQGEYRQPEVDVKAGRGISAVEVPRGILFHDYTYDQDGVCTEANCVIPTNQNHGNIQKDMEKLVPEMLDKPEEEIELALKMLVRAYDPCISCSTHYLNIKWVK